MTDSRTLGQSVPKEGLFLMDGIEGLRSLPKHSVDLLLTDPPYGTTRNYWDVPLPLPELWEAVKWAVKPNGAVLFFAQCPFDKVLGASNLAMLRYEWVWYKERGTGFLNANRAPLKKSENRGEFFLLTMPCFGDCSPLFTRSIKAQDKGPQSQAPAARPQSPAVRGFSEKRQPPSVWRFYRTIAVGHSAKSRVCRALRRF